MEGVEGVRHTVVVLPSTKLGQRFDKTFRVGVVNTAADESVLALEQGENTYVQVVRLLTTTCKTSIKPPIHLNGF